jgi:hypothetical protein
VPDGSFLSARKIHFRTATDFSSSRLNSSSFEIKSGQKVFNVDSHNKQQLFLWTALTHRVFILNLKPKQLTANHINIKHKTKSQISF